MGEINASGFLIGLGRTSVQAGVLVLLIMAAQWLFQKQLTPRWRSALWLVVVGRLLLPSSVGSAVSIFNLVPRWPQRTQAALTLTPAPGVDSRRLEGPPVISTPAQFSQPRSEEPSASEQADLIGRSVSGGVEVVSAQRVAPPAIPQVQHQFLWGVILFWGWLVGALILAGHVAISSVRLARAVSGLPALTDPATEAVLGDCRARLKVRAPLALVESGALTCPALYGLARARLLLPKGFSSRFSEQELRFIFLHELAHLKRRDLLANWVVALLQAVHWFNPLVWVAFAKWQLIGSLPATRWRWMRPARIRAMSMAGRFCVCWRTSLARQWPRGYLAFWKARSNCSNGFEPLPSMSPGAGGNCPRWR
jgi:bla regulator protein BlaR1